MGLPLTSLASLPCPHQPGMPGRAPRGYRGSTMPPWRASWWRGGSPHGSLSSSPCHSVCVEFDLSREDGVTRRRHRPRRTARETTWTGRNSIDARTIRSRSRRSVVLVLVDADEEDDRTWLGYVPEVQKSPVGGGVEPVLLPVADAVNIMYVEVGLHLQVRFAGDVAQENSKSIELVCACPCRMTAASQIQSRLKFSFSSGF